MCEKQLHSRYLTLLYIVCIYTGTDKTRNGTERNETNWGPRRFLKSLNFLFIPLFNLFYSLYTITISLFVNIGTRYKRTSRIIYHSIKRSPPRCGLYLCNRSKSVLIVISNRHYR